MAVVEVGHTDFLSSIRLSLLQLRKPGEDFVGHVYRTVLRRDCELDLSNSDLRNLSDRDPWDRVSYLFSVLFSQESVRTNGTYAAILDALFGGLGYTSARGTLASLMAEVYPALDDLHAAADQITMAISLNTEGILAEQGSGDIGDQLDQALVLRALMRTTGDLTAAISDLRNGMSDISWGISDLRGTANTERAGALGSDSYVAGLLLAILAQLQSGTVK